jgi:hypothetical protein
VALHMTRWDLVLRPDPTAPSQQELWTIYILIPPGKPYILNKLLSENGPGLNRPKIGRRPPLPSRPGVRTTQEFPWLNRASANAPRPVEAFVRR